MQFRLPKGEVGGGEEKKKNPTLAVYPTGLN